MGIPQTLTTYILRFLGWQCLHSASPPRQAAPATPTQREIIVPYGHRGRKLKAIFFMRRSQYVKNYIFLSNVVANQRPSRYRYNANILIASANLVLLRCNLLFLHHYAAYKPLLLALYYLF